MKVIGYVFDQPGERYRYKYYFEGTLDNIARFILQNSPRRKKITITDISDCLICTYDDGLYLFGIENNEANKIVDLVSTAMEYNPIEFELQGDYNMVQI